MEGTYKDDLLPIQLKMIAELIDNGGNKTKACETIGINRQTIYDWLDEEKFVQAYRNACEKMYKEHLDLAINGIVDVAKNGAGRDKVNACTTILKLNDYLSTKVDVTQNTKEEIRIMLIDDEETDE